MERNKNKQGSKKGWQIIKTEENPPPKKDQFLVLLHYSWSIGSTLEQNKGGDVPR